MSVIVRRVVQFPFSGYKNASDFRNHLLSHQNQSFSVVGNKFDIIWSLKRLILSSEMIEAIDVGPFTLYW